MYSKRYLKLKTKAEEKAAKFLKVFRKYMKHSQDSKRKGKIMGRRGQVFDA